MIFSTFFCQYSCRWKCFENWVAKTGWKMLTAIGRPCITKQPASGDGKQLIFQMVNFRQANAVKKKEFILINPPISHYILHA